jgi:NAD(P)-dependent dehydrogenase (short-subunit alcohol dehydrogenase family)
VNVETEPRHVLVTGAANGIGAAICERFAREGHRVTCTDQREDGLHRLCERIAERAEGPAVPIVGDLADDAFADSLVQRAWDRSGPVDILVTAAGIYPAISFRDLTVAAWDRVQAVNVRSVMQLTRSLANLAIAAKRQASVVHISSGAALRARPGAAHYSASKAALEMLTKSAAIELGPFGIRVNAVSPGFVDVDSEVNPVTDAYAAAVSVNPLGRRGRPTDIAAAVYWIAGDEAAWVNGTILRVDGGASAGTTGLPLHWSEPTTFQLLGKREGVSGRDT